MNPPSKAEYVGSMPDWEIKILHAMEKPSLHATAREACEPQWRPSTAQEEVLELTHGRKVDVEEKMEGPISSLNFTWTEGPRSGQLNFWFLNILPRQIVLMKC